MQPAQSYIPTDATSPEQGVVMGMTYDDAVGCWRLDYPCRINGTATHLKRSIYGPQRKTQGEAMRAWIALEEHAKDPDGSLTFKEDADKYLEDHPEVAANQRRVIGAVVAGLGQIRARDMDVAGRDWLDAQTKRVSAKTGKRLSPATIQAYKRYIKCILRYCGHKEYCPDVKIGKPIARKRPFAPWEMLELERVIQENYPWFYPAFDFARCCPIRPEDQFALTAENVTREPFSVKYLAKKTDTWARPIVAESQIQYFQRGPGLVFCRPDGASMYDSPNRAYYSYIWERCCKLAGVVGATFYDLRHNAVAYLRSQGIEDWRIVKAAGWKGPEMLKVYDPDNEYLIAEYDRQLSRRRSASVAPNVALQRQLSTGFIGETSN